MKAHSYQVFILKYVAILPQGFSIFGPKAGYDRAYMIVFIYK